MVLGKSPPGQFLPVNSPQSNCLPVIYPTPNLTLDAGEFTGGDFPDTKLSQKIFPILFKKALTLRELSRTLSTFSGLLNKDNLVLIHHRNLQVLATEMFKMFKRFVSRNSNRNICVQSKFLVEEVRSGTFEGRQVQFVSHATKSLQFLGPKKQDLIPVELKQSENLDSFKLKIKTWIPFEFRCRLGKTHIQQVGFR